MPSAAEAFRSKLPHVSVDPSESTLVIYESKWRIFTDWCNLQHINPLSASENVVSEFLLHLLTEKHLAISTIACYQMAIASTLRATLSNGMAEDRLLCPIRVLRFYIERSMSWKEHKRLLFRSFKPGNKRDIVPSTISGWIRKTILECYTNSPTPLLESHKVKAHQLRSMAASLAFHRQTSMEQIVRTGTVITPSPTYIKGLSLYSADLNQHATGDH